VDVASNEWIARTFKAEAPIRIQDRAVSSGLTSFEWAQGLFKLFPEADFEASDLLLELIERSFANGETFIAEPGGTPLQYIRPPFVVALDRPESWRNPLLRFVSFRARGRFKNKNGNCSIRPISCVHPEARALAKANPNFRFQVRSVFDRTPPCHVIRTMNILNFGYFSAAKLSEAITAIFHSLEPNGIWIVGRTLEEDFTNHATLLGRGSQGWEVLERIGKGSEIEAMAVAARMNP
jgi:hypothetical protein